MSLTGRHEKDAGRLYLIFIAVDYMKAGTLAKILHFKEVVPVGVFYAEMAVSVKHLHLKLLTFPFRRAKVVKTVNW
jgi:hypothetical protein